MLWHGTPTTLLLYYSRSLLHQTDQCGTVAAQGHRETKLCGSLEGSTDLGQSQEAAEGSCTLGLQAAIEACQQHGQQQLGIPGAASKRPLAILLRRLHALLQELESLHIP